MDATKAKVSVEGYTQASVDVSSLQHTFEEYMPCNTMLERAGVRITGFIQRKDVGAGFTTGDGYSWFAQMRFTKGAEAQSGAAGEVMFLFPNALDYQGKGGSQLDRPVAVLTKGNVTEMDIKWIAAMLDMNITGQVVQRRFEDLKFYQERSVSNLQSAVDSLRREYDRLGKEVSGYGH